MNEAQAIALAEKFGAIPMRSYVAFPNENLAAMLTDHRAQVIAELAQQTGVIPDPAGRTYHDDATGTEIGPPTDWYSLGQMSEALATMQAKLEQAQADSARLRDALKEVLAYCTESGHDWMCMVDARSALAAMKEQK